jgi:hypothetical protein
MSSYRWHATTANRSDCAILRGNSAGICSWQTGIARGHRAANAQPFGGLAGSGSSEPVTSLSAASCAAPAVLLRLGMDDSSSRV